MGDLDNKVKKSIERLKAFEPPEGYYLAFSGGKDSVVCKTLLDMAGCKYEAVYRVTSVDPPELVRFIKEKHPDVKREVPRYKDGKPITMWNLIPRKLMPPTRIVRYCCADLKESGGDGRMTVTGVRWAESVNRQRNQGEVTIMGRRAGAELGGNENFMSTDRGGGGAYKRQCRRASRDRAMLQAPQDRRQSDHRLDRRGSMGVYQIKRHSVLLALRRGLSPARLHRLSYGYNERPGTRIFALAEIQSGVFEGV